MNINYHYYVVKTLAVHAGFSDGYAQYIAYFSQQIDDYILNSPFVVDAEPPPFFLENGLAVKLNAKRWAFLPCTTGINMVRTLSNSYMMHTLMPFHFIMPKAYPEVGKDARRDLYRCIPASRKKDLLINRLMETMLENPDAGGKPYLMALGMLLHTFADTFAHAGFSGFHGWENASYVHSVKRGTPLKEAMKKAEINLFRALPSIGHGNVSTAPDNTDAVISLYAKRTEKGGFVPLIVRENGTFFTGCSRMILDTLCKVNGRPLFTAGEWGLLQNKLSQALRFREQRNRKSLLNRWQKAFPEITYGYKKDEHIKMRMEVRHRDPAILRQFKVREESLVDTYSEEADQVRLSAVVLARQISDDFFAYNEAAYRHVHHCTGAYASRSNLTNLAQYTHMAKTSL